MLFAGTAGPCGCPNGEVRRGGTAGRPGKPFCGN